MLDLAAVQHEFKHISDLRPLTASGQKYVLSGRRGGQNVVLKLIKQSDTEDEKLLEREMGAVTKLGCDYVPSVLEWGKRQINGEDQLFIVEEFIHGQSYRELLTKEPKRKLGEVLRLGDVLLRACCDFEAAGLVHRDIKPENLMVGPDGKIWVIDFGIVRFLDAPSLTSTGAMFGRFTLGYGAPEQMRNIKPEIDARADLFAIGVVLYESLYGQNPFYEGKSNQLDVLKHVCDRDLPPLEIPGDDQGAFAEFIAALVARYPSRRPQTANEALEWFREVGQKLAKA
jgi:serine/threonine-protein kinase